MLIRILRTYLRPYVGLLLLVIGLQLIGTMANLYLPTLNAQIIDEGVSQGNTDFIWRTGAIMLAISGVQVICAIFAVYFGSKAAMSFGRDVRGAIFGRVLSFSSRELNKFGAPSLITRNTNDVQQVQMLVVISCTILVAAPITMVGGVIMALREDVGLSWLILVSVVILGTVVTIIATRMAPLFRIMQGRIDVVNRVLREQITGVRVVRAFVREPYETDRFDRANADLTDTATRTGRFMAAMFPTVMLIMNLSTVAVLWFGSQRIASGQLQIGQLTAYLSYLMQILMSVMMATFLLMLAPRAAVSAERIMAVLSTDSSVVPPRVGQTGADLGSCEVNADGTWTIVPERALPRGRHELIVVQRGTGTERVSEPISLTIASGPQALHSARDVIDAVASPAAGPVITLPAANAVTDDQTPSISGRSEPGTTVTVNVSGPAWRGMVDLREVEFSYPGAETPVLRDITFSARAGQTTAIIGSTGAGKTTLISLLPRLFDATGGRAEIDGIDVRELEQDKLWRTIGLVPQKAYLFSGTVASNLRYGKPDATEDEMWHALEVAQAADFVQQMPEKLQAPIAQGGSNVSGGQRQRLSIARALIKRPEIYVFDDSFSALDVATDARLRRALAAETADAAVIIVGQRVSTIRDADQILVLEHGIIVGTGTHDELLDSCPTYLEIVESQLSAEEAAA